MLQDQIKNRKNVKMTRFGSPRVATGRESVRMDRDTPRSPNIPLLAPRRPEKSKQILILPIFGSPMGPPTLSHRALRCF